ncbi:Ubiquitin domain [Trinorchestia longiramus]|nr:Ubiquitin domain [Trinorchestia longiramus]
MDVFLMIRRKKTTIFTDAKETTTVRELKKIIQGILKVAPEDQKLSDESGNEVFSDDKTLSDYNFTGQNARAHTPASIGLCIRGDDGEFEELTFSPLSSPPDLPEVMRQDNPMHE